MLMQIFVETGISDLYLLISALPSQCLVGSYFMPIAFFLRLPNYRHRLHFLPPKLNALVCHHVIPIMDLVAEIRNHNFQVICNAPHVFCKVFEDDAGALELARLPRLCPQIRHINVCNHNFHEYVHHWKINIFPMSTIFMNMSTMGRLTFFPSAPMIRLLICSQKS